jgi:very-short-patch-repair endonuclease
VSHASAAELWRLPLATDRLIHVTAASHGGRPRIKFHRCALVRAERTIHRSVPVTTPERTILDVANGLSASQIERLIRDAEYEHLATAASLVAVVEAHRGARGLKHLRQALGLSAESAGTTRSKLERRFLRFVRDHGLPVPELNYRIELPGRTAYADCAWPEQRLVVELDSRKAHENRHAFESDRARDRALLVAGWTTTRVTWRQLHDEEGALAADLRALLDEINILVA